MRRLALLSLCLSIPSLLSACGGGGGAGSAGAFLHPPVAGLRYETPSHSGVTDEAGGFRFEPGERITFRVGGTVLGTAPAQSVMDPADLLPDVVLPETNDDVFAGAFNERATPVSGLLNRLVFLQTLDADDDLQNGIQVPEPVAGLLSDVQIRFDQTVGGFERDVSFRRLLRDGLRAGLWGGKGRPRPDALKALDTFYAERGFTPRFVRIARIEEDENGDGVIDERQTFRYGPGDSSAQVESDRDADGTPEQIIVNRFNVHGQLEERLTDRDADGEAENVERTTFNDFGNPFETKAFSDGRLQRTVRTHYDDLQRERMIETESFTGRIVNRVTFVLDERGFLLRREVDDDADGRPDRVETFVRDDTGQITLMEVDADGDGNLDLRQRQARDDQGRQILREDDEGADGSIERRVTTIHDDVERTIRREVDDNADGQLEKVTLTTLDEDGRTLAIVTDEGADGTIDRRDLTTYGDGFVLHSEDTNGDGTIDAITTDFIDEDGNLFRRESDTNADGRPEVIEHFAVEPGSAFQVPLFD